MRIEYWSNSRFAEWLRGTDKPKSGTGDQWKSWETASKEKHPIRHWIAEEGLDKLQDIVYSIPDLLYDLKYYITNRWIDQSHALVAHPKHIKPGKWMDLDYRMLYCLFDELVDFVEIEKAYSNYRWEEEKLKDLSWWQGGRWRLRIWRSPEAGKDMLKWEMSLTNEEWLDEDEKHKAEPTQQAIAAKEILELYTWWTEVYPNRPDPYDVSGWSAYCDNKRDRGVGFFETDPSEDKEETAKMLDTIKEMEEKYHQEEEDMLIRLIKLRGSLWT